MTALTEFPSVRNKNVFVKNIPLTCQLDPVVCIPSVFFIGKDGFPLEIVGGAPSAEDFLTKSKAAYEVRQILNPCISKLNVEWCLMIQSCLKIHFLLICKQVERILHFILLNRKLVVCDQSQFFSQPSLLISKVNIGINCFFINCVIIRDGSRKFSWWAYTVEMKLLQPRDAFCSPYV